MDNVQPIAYCKGEAAAKTFGFFGGSKFIRESAKKALLVGAHCVVFHGLDIPFIKKLVKKKSNLLGMRFSLLPLIDMCSVNSFVYASEIQGVQGDPVDLYFQLVDLEKNTAQSGFYPGGLRYMPPASSTLQVVFKNVDTAKIVTRYASQPYAQDTSIWKVSVLATDPIAGTVNIKFVLTEPGATPITRTVSIKAAFLCGVTN